MNYNKLKNEWTKEENYSFRGWDFSHIDGRYKMEELPWDYEKILRKYLNITDRLLDMGTGGGEFLLSLNHPYELTSVTEDYPPNFELCKNKLSPLGISVVQTDNDKLPFADESFDIIINRQASFDIYEVNRVLKPGGYFITQQVGSANNNDLSSKLIEDFEPQISQHTLSRYFDILTMLNFTVTDAYEAFPTELFFDIGALVYYAKIIEWEFPGFSVEACFEKLCDCQRALEEFGYVRATAHRFIIAARKS